MGWRKLIFKQNQPIHIGSGKWGVIKETEIFISGQTMWGALTNLYILKNKANSNNIEEIKGYFKTISNFFPSFDGKNILKPQYKNGEFYLGDFSESKFRAYFVDTLIQTAVEPLSRRAKDESLHEIDYILPKPKKEFQNKKEFKEFKDNIYWIGIINTNKDNFLEEGLRVYVGADTRYGYGELELIEITDLQDKCFWWIKENDNMEIRIGENSPYFIEISNNSLGFEGEEILLAEFNYLQNIPSVKDAKFFINVGSKIKKMDNSTTVKLEKGKLIFSEE
ncbi:MAG: hypothetical protein N2Z81_04160 [Hydrogenothermaceae bacterium]|nr:hypothetical protein [Hydrogenothermaceae bacterium]